MYPTGREGRACPSMPVVRVCIQSNSHYMQMYSMSCTRSSVTPCELIPQCEPTLVPSNPQPNPLCVSPPVLASLPVLTSVIRMPQDEFTLVLGFPFGALHRWQRGGCLPWQQRGTTSTPSWYTPKTPVPVPPPGVRQTWAASICTALALGLGQSLQGLPAAHRQGDQGAGAGGERALLLLLLLLPLLGMWLWCCAT